MVLASNQQSASRTDQYLRKVEEAVLEKLRLTYRNNLIDQKISEVTDRDRKSTGKSHGRTLSNWSTLSSCPSQESRPSKREIRDRLGGIKRIERQLCAFDWSNNSYLISSYLHTYHIPLVHPSPSLALAGYIQLAAILGIMELKERMVHFIEEAS